MGRGSLRRLAIPLAVFLALPLFVVYSHSVAWPIAHGALPNQMAAADSIASRLEPGEPIFVLGSEPKYYFLTDRYSHWPPLFVGYEADTLNPVSRLRRAIESTAGLRYVVVVEGNTEPVRSMVDEIRGDGRLEFRMVVHRLETVELYRLPDDWAGFKYGRPPR